jgi:hypothetical protein
MTDDRDDDDEIDRSDTDEAESFWTDLGFKSEDDDEEDDDDETVE